MIFLTLYIYFRCLHRVFILPGQLEGYGDHDSELAIGAFPFDRDAPPGVKDEHTEFRQQLNHMGRGMYHDNWGVLYIVTALVNQP